MDQFGDCSPVSRIKSAITPVVCSSRLGQHRELGHLLCSVLLASLVPGCPFAEWLPRALGLLLSGFILYRCDSSVTRPASVSDIKGWRDAPPMQQQEIGSDPVK